MTANNSDFSIGRIPELNIGTGTISRLIPLCRKYSIKKPLFITGESSLDNSGTWQKIERMFSDYCRKKISTEPGCEVVDSITGFALSKKIDGIISVGGGSVMDTGKAVSAMVMENEPVKTFLEGVGTKAPSGNRIAHIAVPTTSGTGSEATKNAVLSQTGENGFKKSLRHDNFIPDAVVIDSDLLTGSSPVISVSSGLDAVTQLLEAYISTKANTFTDALSVEGLGYALKALPNVFRDPDNHKYRLDMAYAAYLSGIVLANAGLGIVHGFASVLGAAKPIPHGVVCAILLPESIEEIADCIFAEQELHIETAGKLAAAAELAGADHNSNKKEKAYWLINLLKSWKNDFGIPNLDSFNFSDEDYQEFARLSGIKNTPVMLGEINKLIILKKCR